LSGGSKPETPHPLDYNRHRAVSSELQSLPPSQESSGTDGTFPVISPEISPGGRPPSKIGSVGGAPHIAVFEMWGLSAAIAKPVPRAVFITSGRCAPSPREQTSSATFVIMPRNLTRYYGAGDLHFITCSCYRRQPLLGTKQRRDLFQTVLEQVRRRYQFVVVGYVVMPEHFHLLMSEPQERIPSTVMQALKLGFARRVLAQLRSPQFGPSVAVRTHSTAYLAETLLRLQCLEWSQACRETALHAPQPGEAWPGGVPGTLALEQFPRFCLWRGGAGESQRVASAQDEDSTASRITPTCLSRVVS